MTATASDTSGLTFYPAYCHKASSTFFTWAKLTAHDVHNVLTKKWGFEFQKIYFYLNHPIKYVRLAGTIVAVTELDRRWIFVLDDSSGATIEVVGTKLQPQIRTDKSDVSIPIPGKDERIIDNGADITGYDVGSLVKIKGLIGEFRGTRQIILERISPIRDTNEEVKIWAENTQFLIDVLSKPWYLSPAEQKQLLAEANNDRGRDREAEGKRRERDGKRQKREERHFIQIQKDWARLETEHERDAEACKGESRELFGTSSAKAARKRRRRLERAEHAIAIGDESLGRMKKLSKNDLGDTKAAIVTRTVREASSL